MKLLGNLLHYPLSAAIGLVWTAWLLLGLSSLLAQPPKVRSSQLAVDSIRTAEHHLYGFVLPQKRNGAIEFAVDRQWLLQTYPEFAKQLEMKEVALQEKASQQFSDRMAHWIADCTQEKHLRLKLFLEDELSRIQGTEPAVEASQFMLLQIPAQKILKLSLAKPEFRHLAGLAYKHEIPDITTTSAPVLERKLKELGVNAQAETFDLSGKLPRMQEETDRQWAARQALVEYDYVEAFELQAIGDFVQAAKEPLDLAGILRSVSQSQQNLLSELSEQLQLNLNIPANRNTAQAWREKAGELASKRKSRGVLVHRLDQDLLLATAKLSTHFLAQDGSGAWMEVYQSEQQIDGSQATQEQLDRLSDDPSLKRILPMIELLGGKAQLDQALRQGAATAAALGTARKTFDQFKQASASNLASPPIPMHER